MTKTKPILLSKKISKLEVSLFLLVMLTTVIAVSPQSFFSLELELVPQDYPTTLTNDIQHGNDSVVAWKDEAQEIWSCEEGSSTPSYCSASIYTTGADQQGLDLSRFQTMTLWLEFDGTQSEQHRSLVLYLRNADDRYHISTTNIDTKYNQVFIPLEELESGQTSMGMDSFSVADWWLSERHKNEAHTEFNNVIIIEMQTGYGDFTSEDLIQLKKILWTGERFTDEEIYRFLVISWSALILLLLVFRLIRLRITLENNKKKKLELMEINTLLELENREFSELASTDYLTGLLNRLGIHDALFENIKNWSKRNIPFSLILVDIDKFKLINDSFGHDEGDRILKAIAELLANNIRTTDSVARWGGEEFAILCSNTYVFQAKHIAESLREKLEAAQLSAKTKVTASFGVASAIKSDADDLFHRADQALYEAKKQGRNKVCVDVNFEATTADNISSA